MKKVIWMVITLFMMMISSIQFTFSSNESIINSDNLAKGIVTISYKAEDSLKYKVLITKDTKKISYPFSANGQSVNFPLQLGNGKYSIGLLKNISGTKYAYVSQKSVTLDLKDPNVVYLNSIQNINYSEEMKAIEFGKTLLINEKTTNSRVKAMYNELVKNMSYDYDKISKLTSDYIPNIETTYADMKGICYDYSALFASVQRYHGIPTRLVKGYSKYVEGYHAWNEVFIDGKWVIIDSTVDNTWKGSKSTISMFKSSKDYTKVNDY